MGRNAPASNSMTSQNSASGSLASPSHTARASRVDMPRYATRYSTVRSSGAT